MIPKVTYNHELLDKLVKAMSKKASLKVGIMGKDGVAKRGVSTNASVGAVHEFGSFSRHIPARSFLRMPLYARTDQIFSTIKKVINKTLIDGGIPLLLKQVGVACVSQITEAFETRGFGKWLSLKPNTIKHKIGKNASPLINSRQLSRSITYKVIES